MKRTTFKRTIWTNEQITFLRNNYRSMTNAEIAEKLGKTRRAVTGKARVLGIKKIRRIVTSSRIAFYEDGPGTKLELEGRLKMQNFYDLDVKVGDKVKIEISGYWREKKIRTGKVVFKNDYHITIQEKNYKESFLGAQFYTGDVKLINHKRQ